MDLHIFAAGTIFGAIIFFWGGVLALGQARRARVASRLEKYTRSSPAIVEKHEEKREKASLLREKFKSVSRFAAPKGWIRKAELGLAQADIPLRPEEYVSLHMLGIIAISFLGQIIGGNLFLTALLAFVAALVPPALVRRAKRKRIAQFNSQLGEGLNIMANSLRSGFSFLQAVDTISKEMPPPLSTEFSRLLKEMNLGTTTEEALSNLVRRVDSEDLDLVVTAVKIQRQVGGNLAEILDKIGGTIQQRVRLKRELSTLTAQGRISGLIVGLIPLFIIGALSLINPGYILDMFTHPIGFFLVGWAVCSELIGVMVIRKIVSIEL